MESIKNFIYNINPLVITILIIITVIVILTLIFVLTNSMIKTGQVQKKYQDALNFSRDYFNDRLKTSKFKAFNYDEIHMYLNKSGVYFMTKYKITPLSYMVAKIVFATLAFLLGMSLNVWAGLIATFIGYFSIEFIINESDKSDNKKMLDDIKQVYDTLRIQTKAGVYITSVITDCYLVVQNPRLKDALLKLTSDIAAKNDMESSLDNFRAKFNNEYIDTLVIIIKQSMQTGQASKMFEDIRNQITDIEAAMVLNEKKSIQAKITIVQLLLYSAIIIVSIYIAVQSLGTGLSI